MSKMKLCPIVSTNEMETSALKLKPDKYGVMPWPTDIYTIMTKECDTVEVMELDDLLEQEMSYVGFLGDVDYIPENVERNKVLKALYADGFKVVRVVMSDIEKIRKALETASQMPCKHISQRLVVDEGIEAFARLEQAQGEVLEAMKSLCWFENALREIGSRQYPLKPSDYENLKYIVNKEGETIRAALTRGDCVVPDGFADVSFHTNYVLDNVLDEDEEDSYDIVKKTIRHINKMLSAAPKVKSGWQPIETAPKDGRTIELLEYSPQMSSVYTAWWMPYEEGCGYFSGEFDGSDGHYWVLNDDKDTLIEEDKCLKHWYWRELTLPQPPNMEGRTQ